MIRLEFWELTDSTPEDPVGRYEWCGFIEVADDGTITWEGAAPQWIVDPAGLPELEWMEPMTVLALDTGEKLSHTADPERWARFLPYHFRNPYLICEIVRDDNPWQWPEEEEDDEPIEVTLDIERRIQALLDAQDEAILDGTAHPDEQAMILGQVVEIEPGESLLSQAKRRRARELGEEA